VLAAQPTRGVDVGAIEFIHKRIIRARDEGAGVLLVSSDLEEILGLSDRILVMFEGRIAAESREERFPNANSDSEWGDLEATQHEETLAACSWLSALGLRWAFS